MLSDKGLEAGEEVDCRDIFAQWMIFGVKERKQKFTDYS